MRSNYSTRTQVLIVLEIAALILLFLSFFLLPENAIFYGILIVLLLYHLRSMTKTIFIDNDGIVVNNWFTTEKRKYSFDQFERVVEYVDPIETSVRLNIYLQNDNVIFCEIRGRNYKNIDQLIVEIKRLKEKSGP